MAEEINWKIILDSSAQLIAEHGKKIKALKEKVKDLEMQLEHEINQIWIRIKKLDGDSE